MAASNSPTDDPSVPDPSASSPSPRICYCMRVHEDEIRSAIRAGARTLGELRDRTRAGSGCGTCRIDLIGILEDEGVPRSALDGGRGGNG